VGFLLRRWLADRLPTTLTLGERAVALEIADLASDDTGVAYGKYFLEIVARRTGFASPKQVGNALTKLARDHNLELRIKVGTDKNGNDVYAYRGHQTTYMIPKAGEVLPASAPADTPEGLQWEPDPRDPEQQRKRKQRAKMLPPRRDHNGDHAPTDDASAVPDGKVPPPQDHVDEKGPTDHPERSRDQGRKVPRKSDKVPPQRDPSPHFSSRTSPQESLSQATSPTDMLATLGVEERERDRLIQKIEEQNNVQGVGWWINARKNGTLADCLQRARADPPDTHAMTWDEVRRNGGKTTPTGSRSVAHNGFKPYRNPENPETAYAGYTHRRPSTTDRAVAEAAALAADIEEQERQGIPWRPALDPAP
jgi:hypothetical protein